MSRDKYVKIEMPDYPVFIGRSPWNELSELIRTYQNSGGVFLLADRNTNKFCLPLLREYVPEINSCPVLIVNPGERSKNIHAISRIWKWLMENDAQKDSLLINVGGGVISDLGGFAAATFKRGIAYINVPTSLIGQSDAAIGGKTGVNVSGIKNQAGIFYDPAAVVVIPEFLQTLPVRHRDSGKAEILKSALLAGNGFWQELLDKGMHGDGNLEDFISRSVAFKCSVVRADPFEQSIRKCLNFGHTIGHAVEALSYFPGRRRVFHGEAVAAGMICEAFLSGMVAGMSMDDVSKISKTIRSYFRLTEIKKDDFEKLIRLTAHDKKRSSGKTGFSLLSAPGKPVMNIHAEDNYLVESFEYFNREIYHDQR